MEDSRGKSQAKVHWKTQEGSLRLRCNGRLKREGALEDSRGRSQAKVHWKTQEGGLRLRCIGRLKREVSG